MRAGAPVVSLCCQTADGAHETVAAEIERRVGGVTAQSREAFAAGERRLGRHERRGHLDHERPRLQVGLAVVALTVYIATLARRREYGVLKALGARNRVLYRVVLAQAVLSVALGFVIGLVFTWLLGFLVVRTGLDLELVITGTSLVKVGLFAAVIAGFAAILPIRQVAGLDPAIVFRRGVVT
jgi:putative ABC transport system permease protein